MPTNHAITIPSANGAPNPSGTPIITGEGAPASPTQQNPWLCHFACTVTGHTDTVDLLWVDPGTINDDNYDPNLPGGGFSLTPEESNDPNFGTVTFTYDPPL
jgi:hypothetical protein